jgi:threonine dehydrogenase-like Zn-dependent dehydrogenase
MKALVVRPSGVEVTDRPDPVAERDSVVVRVHSCGICGSDVHAVETGYRPSGSILGHEMSGTIAELGPGVSGWLVGQAVAVNPLIGCGECTACWHQLPLVCQRRPNLGLTAPGGFAEYLAAPASQLQALPEGVDVELGAHAEPLAVALHAVGLAGLTPGDDALVFGVGPIGLNVIIALRLAGAGRVVAVGRSPGRRTAAAAVGADVVLDSRETDVREYATAEGLAFAAAFECSAAADAVATCAATLATRGTLVEVGLMGMPTSVDLRLFVGRNLHLVGSCAFGPAEYERAVSLLTSGAVNPNPLVSERIALSAAPDAFERLRRPGDLVGVVVQPWR